MTRRLDSLIFGDPVKLPEDRPTPQHGDRPPRQAKPLLDEAFLAELREVARQHPAPIILPIPTRSACAWWPPLVGVVRLPSPPSSDGKVTLVMLKKRTPEEP